MLVDVNSLGYRTDIMLLSMLGCGIDDRGDHLVIRTPSQPTFHWGNFLLFAEPPVAGDAQRWPELFRAEFPDANHMVFGIDTEDGTTGDLTEFVAAGFTPRADLVLAAPYVPEPPGVNHQAEYRILESDDDWQQAIDLQAADNHLYPAANYLLFLQRKMAAMRELQDAGHGGWLGAFLEERMVSTIGIYSDEECIARYQSIDTLAEFRGRGFAGSLVHYASEFAIEELGARTLVIVTDPTYAATRTYRSVGFTDVQHQVGLSAT